MFERDIQKFNVEFSDTTERVFLEAGKEASLMRHHIVGTPHLVLGLIIEGSVRRLMLRTGYSTNIEVARRLVTNQFYEGEFSYDHPLTEAVSAAIRNATDQVISRGENRILPVDLYGALLVNPNKGLAEELLEGLRLKTHLF